MTPPVPPRPRSGVVVTGAASALGRRVCDRLVAADGVDRVIGLDRVRVTRPGVEGHLVDAVDLKELLGGAAALIHLGPSTAPDLDGTGVGPDVGLTRDLLDAAGSASVPHLVVLSSAMVYGAWANNAVPLTEDAPLRPVPSLAFAVERAEEERLVGEWADGHPESRVVILRTSLTAAEDTQDWMSRSPWPRVGLHAGDREPPAQFLHLDDLAAAIDMARTASFAGARNVAPDGWIPPDTLRALVSPAPLIRLPEPIAGRVAAVRWRAGLTTTPPGVLPYTMQPWVVANDRLRDAGWAARHTNEEAFVAGHRAGPLATMSPRRRQELSLFATGAVAATALTVVTLVLRRGRRRRRD